MTAVFELPEEPELVRHNRELREALKTITRAAGGDPGRPDWSPEDAVELVVGVVGDPDDLRMEAAEKRAVERALAASGGNRRKAARLLNIGKTTLYRKIYQFGIKQDEE